MNFFKQLAALFVSFFGLVGLAHAELPPAVITAITGAETDVTAAGGYILAVIVGIAVIAWVRKVIH